MTLTLNYLNTKATKFFIHKQIDYFSLIGYPKKGFNFSKTIFLALGGGGGRWVASAWVVYESIRIITFVVVVVNSKIGGVVHSPHNAYKTFFFESTKGCLTRG